MEGGVGAGDFKPDLGSFANDDSDVEDITPDKHTINNQQSGFVGGRVGNATVFLSDDEDGQGESEDDDIAEINPHPQNHPFKQTNSQLHSGRFGCGLFSSPSSSLKKSGEEVECIDLTGEEPLEADVDVEMISVADSSHSNQDPQADLPELIEIEPPSKQQIADECRKVGNDHFKRGNYNQAFTEYSKAIDMMPEEASYYANRAACLMMMKQYRKALEDTQSSLRLDPQYVKSYVRKIRICLALGDVKSCESELQEFTAAGFSPSEILAELQKLNELKKYRSELETTELKKDHRKALYLCDRILEISTGDFEMRVKKAYTLIRLGRHVEAGEIATEIIGGDKQNVDGHIIRALCHFQLDNLEKSISFLRAALQLNPDSSHAKIKYKRIKQLKDIREKANESYKNKNIGEAKSLYLEALELLRGDEESKNTLLESKLLFNVSLMLGKLSETDEAIRYASEAIALNASYSKAFLHRATLHSQKEMFDEAVRDYEACLKLDPSRRELRSDMERAKLNAKKAKRKDYYKILNIPKTATDDDIRKAYKKRAMVHHPDRHSTASEEVQKEQEKCFKDVGEAYEVLSDHKRRFRYDQGHDVMDGGGGGGGGASTFGDVYDANQIFNMFFTGPSMGAQNRNRRYEYFTTRGAGGTYGYR